MKFGKENNLKQDKGIVYGVYNGYNITLSDGFGTKSIVVFSYFDENAIKALSSNCNGSTRYLNNLIDKALMICCNQKKQTVTTDTVMLATNDLSLI